MLRNIAALGVMTLLALPLSGAAQGQDQRFIGQTGEAIIFRDANFSGPSLHLTRDQPDLRLAWQVRSIRVMRGEWQLCTGRNHSGLCTTARADMSNIPVQFRFVRSVRVMGWSPPGGGGGGRSLRGMAAEFFPEPMRYGRRIECPGGQSTAACAKRTADDFCRAAGWNGSRNQMLQTVGRRNYIADVLCVRSGF